MKRVITFLGLFLLALAPVLSSAQEKLRIAVFDPTITGKPFDEGTAVTVREMVSSVVVNTGKYTMIERSLINRIMEEQKFSNSGAVDESQASQLGKLAGASKIILSVLSSSGERALLSLKMIDVESASVESQKTKLVRHSELLDIIVPLAMELIGERTSFPSSSVSSPEITKMPTPFERYYDGKLDSSEPKENKASSPRNEFAQRMNREEGTDFATPSTSGTGEEYFVLVFPGFSNKKNPGALIYVDGVSIGNGTLNEGFNLSVKDSSPGRHLVKIKWSGMIDSQTYIIHTNVKKRFHFEYAKTGFGYAMKLIDN